MDMTKVIEDLDLLRDLFIEHSIATEEEIDLVTSINGNNLDAYNDILDVRTGYKSWEQYVGFDEDDCRQILKETLEDGAKSQDKFTSLYDVVTESQVDDFLDHLMEDVDCFNFEDKTNLNEYDLIEEFLEFFSNEGICQCTECGRLFKKEDGCQDDNEDAFCDDKCMNEYHSYMD